MSKQRFWGGFGVVLRGFGVRSEDLGYRYSRSNGFEGLSPMGTDSGVYS